MNEYLYTRELVSGYWNLSVDNLEPAVAAIFPSKEFHLVFNGTSVSVVFDIALSGAELTILATEVGDTKTAFSALDTSKALRVEQVDIRTIELQGDLQETNDSAALKLSIGAAVDQEALDAIADTRTENGYARYNVTASAPGVTDDSDAGYNVRSVWVDTSTNKVWVCTDSTVGAAVWVDTTSSGGIVSHASTTGRTANDHHTELHTVASHSDTTATGSELNTLVGGGNADSLHVHAGTDDQTAAEVPFTANGDIAATNVQAAIQEVRDDTDTKLSGKSATGHSHSDLLELDGTGAMTGALNMNSQSINSYLRAAYKVIALGTIGAQNVDCDAGQEFTCAVTGNVTFTLTNKPSVGNGTTIGIEVTQDATGRTVTFADTIIWHNSEGAPVAPSADGDTLYVVIKWNGINLRGSWYAE